MLSSKVRGDSQKFTAKQLDNTLDKLIEHGVQRGASDIHIEPYDSFVLVRYRIDGHLTNAHKLPLASLHALMSTLKKRANLSSETSDLPADGSYNQPIEGKDIHIGVATMPVFGGEKAVLHLSAPLGKPVELPTLGFWGQNLTTLQTILASPHGLVVVASPRHNGATSTLFGLLDQLNNPIASLATVELHPKHRLPGVNQTYTAPSGISMADGFKAVLKQDPNIVMLGDIPDGTTASLAVHAASTGQFILARMHADGAVAAAVHLRAAGAEPFLLASTLKACVGQHLVRALCTHCRQRYALDHDEQQQIASRFGITTSAARKRVHELESQLAPLLSGDTTQLNSTAASITHLWRPSAEGCPQCNHSGYQGRVAIVEVLTSSDPLHKALLGKELPAVAALHASLLKTGFIPFALDGLIKALRGQTTAAEVLRAAGAPSL